MNQTKFFGIYEEKVLKLITEMNPEELLYSGTDAVYEFGSFELPLGVWRNIVKRLKGLVPDELQHRLEYGPEYMAFDITPTGPVQTDIFKPERTGTIENYFGYDLVEVYGLGEVKVIQKGLEKLGKDEKTQEGKTAFHLSQVLNNNFFKEGFSHLLIYCEL